MNPEEAVYREFADVPSAWSYTKCRGIAWPVQKQHGPYVPELMLLIFRPRARVASLVRSNAKSIASKSGRPSGAAASSTFRTCHRHLKDAADKVCHRARADARGRVNAQLGFKVTGFVGFLAPAAERAAIRHDRIRWKYKL